MYSFRDRSEATPAAAVAAGISDFAPSASATAAVGEPFAALSDQEIAARAEEARALIAELHIAAEKAEAAQRKAVADFQAKPTQASFSAKGVADELARQASDAAAMASADNALLFAEAKRREFRQKLAGLEARDAELADVLDATAVRIAKAYGDLASQVKAELAVLTRTVTEKASAERELGQRPTTLDNAILLVNEHLSDAFGAPKESNPHFARLVLLGNGGAKITTAEIVLRIPTEVA